MRGERTRLDVEGDDRARVEIVAGSRIPDPGRRVADTPVREPEGRVVAAGYPDRRAAGPPGVSGPGLVSWLARAGNGERFPPGLARRGVERLNETSDPELSSGNADHHVSFRDERREGHVVAELVILDGLLPDEVSGLRVERHHVGVECGEIDLVEI